MCAMNGIQLSASNAKCTYLRKSVGTLLYLSIRGVQGVNMITVMLMAVHALKVCCRARCGTAAPRCGTAALTTTAQLQPNNIQGMNVTLT